MANASPITEEKLTGTVVDSFALDRVVVHFYGPSGGMYGSVPRSELTEVLGSDLFGTLLAGQSPESMGQQAAMAVIEITRRSAPITDGALTTLAASLMFNHVSADRPAADAARICGLIAADANDKVMMRAYLFDEFEQFAKDWREMFRVVGAARERVHGAPTSTAKN